MGKKIDEVIANSLGDCSHLESDYTAAGVADPDKLHQTILDKGGRIKE